MSLAKGIELDTLMRMSQVIVQVTGVDPSRVAVVTGPNLASEIAEEQPAATVVACSDSGRAVALQRALSTGYFRPYTNADVVGAEIGGACKNVIALACGMAAGVGLGENTAAAIITRGLAEIMRLGIALGAKPATLAGLAGIGDLVATCMSPHSRNRSFGERLARGGTMEPALAAAGGHVAEGVTSCKSVLALASSYDVEMPLTEAVHRVCHKGSVRRRSGRTAARSQHQTGVDEMDRSVRRFHPQRESCCAQKRFRAQPVAPPPVPASAYHIPARRRRFTGQLRSPVAIRRGGNWNRRSPQLEGAATALTFGSGMAAITSVLRTVAKPGRTVVVPADGYYQVRAYANEFLAPRGVTVVEARCAEMCTRGAAAAAMWCWPRRRPTRVWTSWICTSWR